MLRLNSSSSCFGSGTAWLLFPNGELKKANLEVFGEVPFDVWPAVALLCNLEGVPSASTSFILFVWVVGLVPSALLGDPEPPNQPLSIPPRAASGDFPLLLSPVRGIVTDEGRPLPRSVDGESVTCGIE